MDTESRLQKIEAEVHSTRMLVCIVLAILLVFSLLTVAGAIVSVAAQRREARAHEAAMKQMIASEERALHLPLDTGKKRVDPPR